MRPRLGIALLATFLLTLGGATGAEAAITVSNTNDSGPGSLRQAIAEAPPGETIILPAGTYTLTSSELLIPKKSLSIEGHGAADTTIRAGGAFRVFLVAEAPQLTVSGVTIRDGNKTGSPADGAGVLSVNTTLTLRDVVVRNNTSNANGAAGVAGGLAEGAGILSVGTLNLINSTVTDNLATAVGGSGAKGGLAEGAGILSVGPLNISGSTIANNVADARGGQGASNPAQDGGLAEAGGILTVLSEGPGASITASTLSGNTADASGGPGGTAGTVEGAGMLAVANGPALTIASSTVASNVARALPEGGNVLGGGILAVATPPGAISIKGATLAGNRIEAPAPSGGSGGGNLFAVGNISLGGTIVSGGAGPAGSENCFLVTEATPSLGFNLDSTSQCGFQANGDQVNKDPLLGPLQDNGGLTQTMVPASNSPAVDQGASFGVASDQRGVIRPIDFPTIPNAAGGDGSDIGAAELQPSNVFTLGKLKRNKKKGTATLTVNLPQPSSGTLTLEGKGLKRKIAAIAGEATKRFKVASKGGVRKALRKRGKRKVKIKVTYTPTGNASATLTRKTKLVRKRKKHHRRGAKR
jgi:hypothetical protein